jgi:hypothetical protein
LFPKSHRPNDSDAKRIAKTMEACLHPEFQFHDARAHSSPFSGREDRGAYIITPVMALLRSASCSNMPLSQKQAQTGVMLHRAPPSLGWRAWNA